MSKERIDLTKFEHDHENPPKELECAECGRSIISESGDNFFACNRCGWTGYPSDAQAILMVDELVAELKRYYGFVDELLTYFHHTQLENESFLDLLHRMGVFEEE
tara:strand:- start:152 stop:466 length:315 start_codon:yes stop_codon:yes gene_type:complete